MEKYDFSIYCRCGGTWDLVGCHTTESFSDDKVATRGMEEIAQHDFLPHHDNVIGCTIKRGEKVVDRFVLVRYVRERPPRTRIPLENEYQIHIYSLARKAR